MSDTATATKPTLVFVHVETKKEFTLVGVTTDKKTTKKVARMRGPEGVEFSEPLTPDLRGLAEDLAKLGYKVEKRA